MPLYDEYAQQVPFPVQTDRANIRAWGEALVDSVVQRSIMRFPSESVRSAVITSPRAGMQTWIEDVKRMELYDGTRWVATAFGAYAWSNISLAPDFTVSNNNSQGTPQYRVVELFGERALMLRGGVGITYGSGGVPPNAGVLTSQPLPGTAQPATRRTVPLAASVVGGAEPSVKLDINTTGHLAIVGINSSQNSPPWVSLNGVMCSL